MTKKDSKIIIYVYLVILALMVINIYYVNFRIEMAYYANLIIYYSLAGAAVYAIYQIKNQKMLIVVNIFLLFLSANIYLYIPAFTLIPLIFSKEINNKVRVASSFIMGISILLIVTVMVVSLFDKPPVNIEQKVSPDNKKVIASMYYYLPTETVVRFEQKFAFNQIVIYRTLYTTNFGNNVDMKWLDNDTVIINNQNINVYFTHAIREHG